MYTVNQGLPGGGRPKQAVRASEERVSSSCGAFLFCWSKRVKKRNERKEEEPWKDEDKRKKSDSGVWFPTSPSPPKTEMLQMSAKPVVLLHHHHHHDRQIRAAASPTKPRPVRSGTEVTSPPESHGMSGSRRIGLC